MASCVAQKYPYCAAASVAGALNALMRARGHEMTQWTAHDLLHYYIRMTDERIASQRQKLTLASTKLSEDQLTVLTDCVCMHLDRVYQIKLGNTTKGNKDKAIKPIVLQALQDCLDDNALDIPSSIRDLFFPSSQEHESTHEGEHSVVFEIPSMTPKALQLAFYLYIHLLDGRAKLANATRPSTAICGNAAIIFAVESISKDLEGKNKPIAFTAQLLVGLSSPSRPQVEHIISRKDSSERREVVWRQVWEAFVRDDTVLIIHIKNHYALVFALRQWQDDDTMRRQVLTARRGQCPSIWIEWEEVCETFCSWQGYKLLSVVARST